MATALAESLSTATTQSDATLAVRRAAARVLAALTAAILEARRRARQVAAEQVAAEVAQMTAMGADVAPPVLADPTQTDTAHAESASASYAAAWMALALAAVSAWSRDGSNTPLTAVVTTTIKRSDYRIARIVTTESARAHSHEHRTRADAIKKANEGRRWLGRAFRRWDARLDRVVCSVCRSHESEETNIGGTFTQGHEPGDVHPGCRCIATLIMLPLDRNEVDGLNERVRAPYVESARTAA